MGIKSIIFLFGLRNVKDQKKKLKLRKYMKDRRDRIERKMFEI